MSSFDNKLKVNLKLTTNRVKMLIAKSDALQQSQRKEIANLLSSGKIESARIKVEFLIQQDYNREAMEVLELFCDLLLARKLDVSIQEAVHTIIWAASRTGADLKELLVIRNLLVSRYGRDFGEAAMANRLGLANPRVVQRLSVSIPSAKMVNAYLREIAAKYNVEIPAELSEESVQTAIIAPVSMAPFESVLDFPQAEPSPTSSAASRDDSTTVVIQPPLHLAPPATMTIPSLPGSDDESGSGEISFPEPPKRNTSSAASKGKASTKDNKPSTDNSIKDHKTEDKAATPPEYSVEPDTAPDFDELARRFEELKNKK